MEMPTGSKRTRHKDPPAARRGRQVIRRKSENRGKQVSSPTWQVRYARALYVSVVPLASLGPKPSGETGGSHTDVASVRKRITASRRRHFHPVNLGFLKARKGYRNPLPCPLRLTNRLPSGVTLGDSMRGKTWLRPTGRTPLRYAVNTE